MKDFGVSRTNINEYDKLIQSLWLKAMDREMGKEQLEEMDAMYWEMAYKKLEEMETMDSKMAKEKLEKVNLKIRASF